MLAELQLNPKRRPGMEYLSELQGARLFYAHQIVRGLKLAPAEDRHLKQIIREIGRISPVLIQRWKKKEKK